MIIDSHAHYAHPRFDGEFSALCLQDGEYALCRTERDALIEEMKKAGIVGFIEPSIGFDAIEKQIELVEKHSDCMKLSLGVHPTRCINNKFSSRKELKKYALTHTPLAIGETGLDYHYPGKMQYRARQKRWFVYQIKLADELGLPLVLHVRDADKHALRILKRHKKRLHGGVAHCYTGGVALAEEYISLGFTLGIGGKLMCDNDKGRELCEVVKSVPLSAILVETDAPFVLPDTDESLCSGKQRRKLCNSSFILPKLIERIAELRGEDAAEVENAIYENTLRAFGMAEEKTVGESEQE